MARGVFPTRFFPTQTSGATRRPLSFTSGFFVNPVFSCVTPAFRFQHRRQSAAFSPQTQTAAFPTGALQTQNQTAALPKERDLENNKQWTVTVRDRLMVARTFGGQAAGGTLLLDASFRGPELQGPCRGGPNFLVDIGKATEVLKNISEKYAYADLGIIFARKHVNAPPSKEVEVSLEFFAQHLWKEIAQALAGAAGAGRVEKLVVRLEDVGTGRAATFASAYASWKQEHNETSSSAGCSGGVASAGNIVGELAIDIAGNPRDQGCDQVTSLVAGISSPSVRLSRRMGEEEDGGGAPIFSRFLFDFRELEDVLARSVDKRKIDGDLNLLWTEIARTLKRRHVVRETENSLRLRVSSGNGQALERLLAPAPHDVDSVAMEEVKGGVDALAVAMGRKRGSLVRSGVFSKSVSSVSSSPMPMRVTHSFQGDCFGPAQKLHGTSFVVQGWLENFSKDFLHEFLDPVLRRVIGRYDARNLDQDER